MNPAKEIQETPEHLHLQLAARYVALYSEGNYEGICALQRTFHFRNDHVQDRIVYFDMKDVEVLSLRKFRAKLFDVFEKSGKVVVCASLDECNMRRIDRMTARFISGMQKIMFDEQARARQAQMTLRVFEDNDRQKSERIRELEDAVSRLEADNAKKGAVLAAAEQVLANIVGLAQEVAECSAEVGKIEAERTKEFKAAVHSLAMESRKKSSVVYDAQHMLRNIADLAREAAECSAAVGKIEAERTKEVEAAVHLLAMESRKKGTAAYDAQHMLGNAIELAQEAVECCGIFARNEAQSYETAVELLAVENVEKSSALVTAQRMAGELVDLAQEAADMCDALAANEAVPKQGDNSTTKELVFVPDINVRSEIAALCNELTKVSQALSLGLPDFEASYKSYEKQRQKIATLLRESYSKNKLLQSENKHLVKLKDSMLQNQKRFTETMLKLEAQCGLEQYHSRMLMAQQCNKWLQRRPAMKQAVLRFVFGEWWTQAQDQDNFSQRRHRLHTMQRHDAMLQRHPNVGRMVLRMVLSAWRMALDISPDVPHSRVHLTHNGTVFRAWARTVLRMVLSAWRMALDMPHLTHNRTVFRAWARTVHASRVRRWTKLHRTEAVCALQAKHQTALMRAAFAELYDAYVCLGRDVEWESMQVCAVDLSARSWFCRTRPQ